MWAPENRKHYDRKGLRYPSDMTDSEWALIEPLIPPAKHGGRKREVNLREVVNAIFYVLSTGCQWRFIPKDLVPKSTAYEYFRLWDWDDLPMLDTRAKLRQQPPRHSASGNWRSLSALIAPKDLSSYPSAGLSKEPLVGLVGVEG